MKPTKNRKYCQGCGRTKMLFKEQKNADNFIRFNQDNILEENCKAPVRSYYCTFCSGWHVTSNPSLEYGESLNRRDCEFLENIASRKRKIRDFYSTVIETIIDIKKAVYLSIDDYSINQAYEHCKLILQSKSPNVLSDTKRKALVQQLDMIGKILPIFTRLNQMNRPELTTYIETVTQTIENNDLINRYAFSRYIYLSLKESTELYHIGEANKAETIKEELLDKLKKIEGPFSNQFKKKFRQLISETFEKLTEQYHNTNFLVSHKEILLQLISDLETIDHEFEQLNFTMCTDLVDNGLVQLSKMPKDQIADAIREHYKKWKITLSIV